MQDSRSDDDSVKYVDTGENNEIEHKSNHDSEDEDDNPLEHLKAILEAIQFEEVPAFALQVRRRLAESEDKAANEIFQLAVNSSTPLTGSYLVLFPINFDDGIRWLLKIPGIGIKETWDNAAATNYDTNTRVLEFNASLENPLGVPFILMEYVEGLSLYDVWFDITVSKDELEAKRTRTLENIAKAMVQLSKFSFEQGGSIMFNGQGQPSGIGPSREVNNHAMLARLDEEDENKTPIYVHYGPFDSTKSFFLERFIKRPEPNADWQKMDLALLRFFLDLIPEQSGDTKPFVLTHPDLGFQNIIVSQDGYLKAIIDWDGVAAVPRSIGNERYPSWLTRDWDPAMYGWKEGIEIDPDLTGCREDSQATLKFYRAVYARLIQSFKLKDNISHSTAPDATIQFLVVESLLIAVEDSLCTHGILENLFAKVIAAFTEGSGAETFDYWEIANSLVEGNLSQRRKEVLKTGFDAVLGGYGG